MSALIDTLHAARVRNAYEFYNGDTPAGQVSIGYTVEANPRSPFSSRWFVYRKGYQTDPGAHWSDHGNKTFQPYNYPGTTAEARRAALAAAQEWAAGRYGITDWKRDPFGSYGDAEFVNARVADLKAQAAQAAQGAVR